MNKRTPISGQGGTPHGTSRRDFMAASVTPALSASLSPLAVRFTPAELTEFDAGLNQVVVHGKRLRDGLLELSNVAAPLKTGR